MDDTPRFYLSEHPLEDWYSVAEYAAELDVRREWVLAACNMGLLSGWRPTATGRWRIPPEMVDEKLWGWTERQLHKSPRGIARYCAVVFNLDRGDQYRLERALVEVVSDDPMAEVARWMLRGIAAERKGVARSTKKAVLERDAGRCVYCRRKAKRMEYDHVVPVSWGGGRTATNVVLACRECNRLKRDAPASHCLTCERLTWEVAQGRNRCGCFARPFR